MIHCKILHTGSGPFGFKKSYLPYIIHKFKRNTALTEIVVDLPKCIFFYLPRLNYLIIIIIIAFAFKQLG